jgi:DNA-binding response OmpR family regulator
MAFTNTSTHPFHILFVDDDVRLQKSIQEFFTFCGYTVSSMPDGKNIEGTVQELSPDIVLLDVMFADDDGFSILRRLRTVSSVPVIILSARGEELDKILGLEQGADDYVTKPFNPQELLARVKAVLRRTSDGPKGVLNTTYPEGSLTTGEITLNCDRQTLKRLEREIKLSTAEFAVVYVLMKHAGKVLSRDEILTMAFGSDYYVSDRSIDVHINRLRKLLSNLGAGGMRIRTVWGRGYTWSAGG